MVRVLIAGDFCIHDRMKLLTGEQIAQSMLSVRPYVNGADYSLLNLESAISERKYKPIQKCGPHLLNGYEMLVAIKALGFDAVTLANNHFADYGPDAVADSLKMLDDYGIEYVGAGNNLLEATQVLYKKVRNLRLAFVNCCEHEFSIATDDIGGCNPLDVVVVTQSIQEAKKNSDKVIVIVHGGTEFYNLPTPRMQQTYRFFVEQGADAIINHHQHCYSGYEYYQETPIVYGLGNFCFDMEGMRNHMWNEGYMVCLLIGEKVTIELIPYKQCDERPGVYVLEKRKDFDLKIGELNQIIADSNTVKEAYNQLKDSKKSEYLHLFQLPQNRTMRRLVKKKLVPQKLQEILLPTFLTRERATNLLSFFQCEAHNDLMKLILKDYIK
ncbi:MAG: CapA family protein [Lachnospira sp.]